MPDVLSLFSLQGRSAVLTGATRGIGEAIAIALAEAGADIVLIQRDSSNVSTKEKIEKLGRKATIYEADLADHSQISGLVKKITGDGHDLSILVNCGGIQRRHPPHQFPDEDWNDKFTSILASRNRTADVPNTGASSQSQHSLYTLS